MDDDAADEFCEIDDLRVPQALREHAERFRTPVRYVGIYGPDVVLFAGDGEVVDICAIA